MAKLSDARIRAIKPGIRERWVGDGLGLWLRVLPSGSKVFIIRSKRNGKTTIVTLGNWPDFGLAKARLAVLERKTHSNPVADVHVNISVRTLAEEFYSRIIEPKYRRTKNARGYLDNAILPELGELKLRQVTQAAVVSMVKKYVPRGPVAANRLLSTTKQMFGYALEVGYLEHNPAAGITTRVAGGDEIARDRVLSNHELRLLWHAKASHTPLLRFLLLTLARIGEAQKAQWAHIDLVTRRWAIPKEHSKNGRAHWVHLTDATLDVLRLPGEERSLILRSASETAVQAWLRRWCARERIEPAFTPHDLRRTAATRCGDLGIPPHIVEKLLNHTMQGVLQVYNRAEYEAERLQATERWAAELRRIVG